VSPHATILPAPPVFTLADLARIAAESLARACSRERDAITEVLTGSPRRTARLFLPVDRITAAAACLDLAVRLPKGSDARSEAEAIADACRGGYAVPEMGLRLMRLAAGSEEQRDTEPGQAWG
jgi:hypothetical protein